MRLIFKNDKGYIYAEPEWDYDTLDYVVYDNTGKEIKSFTDDEKAMRYLEDM